MTNYIHEKPGPRVDVFKFDVEYGAEIPFLLASDLHLDNPKTDRQLIQKHCSLIRDRGGFILLNGDTFCAMQGKYDKRSSKSDIRDEHKSGNYLDLLVNTTAEFLAPYPVIFMGLGNHETAILERHETNLIERCVERMNFNREQKVVSGGYSGWIILHFATQKDGSGVKTVKIWYHHGYGGGGPVTKGSIQNNRVQTYVQGADIVWMGHVHELYNIDYQVETLSHTLKSVTKSVEHVRTSTYKEEYMGSEKGWHIQRGGPPKPIGSYVLNVKADKYSGFQLEKLK